MVEAQRRNEAEMSQFKVASRGSREKRTYILIMNHRYVDEIRMNDCLGSYISIRIFTCHRSKGLKI